MPPPSLQATLSVYDISVNTGFAPPDPLPTSLDAYGEQWKVYIKTAQDVPSLISDETLRSTVESLPQTPISSIESMDSDLPSQKLAYIVLSGIAQSYIFGNHLKEEPLKDTLPAVVAIPLMEIAEKLEIEPGISYAARSLWNFKLDEKSKNAVVMPGEGPEKELLDLIFSFTGTPDEAAFNLIVLGIEREGGNALRSALEASQLTAKRNLDAVKGRLDRVTASLKECSEQIKKLFTLVKPDVFYHQLRPFLTGFGGAESKLPKGVFYGSSISDKSQGAWVKSSGSTAGQSSLFQALDVILGVHHSDESGRAQFVKDMRKSMPGAHRRFLEDITALPSISGFVKSDASNPALKDSYNSALGALRDYRSEHFKVVTRYVIQTSRQARAGQEETRGTGGSELSTLLKGMREDTEKSLVQKD